MAPVLRRSFPRLRAAAAGLWLLLFPAPRRSGTFHRCHGFSVPDPPAGLPHRLEDWEASHVGDWLRSVGFGRYASGFASDFGGTGVDGDRLVYLGTEDQLDHIEYQLELVGVADRSDQAVLGAAIVGLVALERTTPGDLEALARGVLRPGGTTQAGGGPPEPEDPAAPGSVVGHYDI